MIRRAAYQQVVVVDAPSTALLLTPPTHLSHSHTHSQHSQQIHKIPIHLIKRSRAVLVKDLERLAPGVTRVVTDQGTVLYPDSPDNNSSSSIPSSPRSPTFSGSASSGGSQAYIPIPEGEEDNSIWFVHSRPSNTSRSIQTSSYSSATRDHHGRPTSMEHGPQGRSASHNSPQTKKEAKEAVFEKEAHHEHEQEEEHHNSSRTQSHPPQLRQAQERGLERFCGQSQAAGRTRVQQGQVADLSTAYRPSHRRIGSQESSSSSSQHQDLDVKENCGNPRCQETAETLVGLAQAVLASLGGDGQGDIVALQKMATKILDSTSTTIVQSTFLSTPPQSSIFSSPSPSVSKFAQGMVTPETTPVSTPIISASCTTHTSPPPLPLSPQHQRRPSSSSSMVLSPPMITDSFQAVLSGQYPNPAALTLPSAMIAVTSPKKTKKKKSAFLAIFQQRGEGEGERPAQGQGQGQGGEEGKKAWFKTTRRRQTLPSSTAPGLSSSQTPTSPGGTSQSPGRRFSVPFGFHLKGASSSSTSSSSYNAPPTPPLPPLPMSPTSGQRQNCAQYPAGRRPSAQRHGSRMQVGTGSFLDSVSDESTTEDDEEEEEVLERRRVIPQQQSVQNQGRHQVYDSDESTDTDSEDSDDENDEEDSDDSEDDEQHEQVEGPLQQRRPWRRWTAPQSSNSSIQQQAQRQRQQQGHIRWATSPSADQIRRTLEGYEHDFDDTPPPAYQSSVIPPLPVATSSSQGGTIMPLSVSGSLARQYSIPPRSYHYPSSSSSPSPLSASRARAVPPPIPARPLSNSAFPAMQVISSSSSTSSLPLSTPVSLASSATSSSSISSSTPTLPTLLSLLHCLESRLSASQRSASFTKYPSSSERESWRARQPGTIVSFAYVLIALEQTGVAPGAMSASWRGARDSVGKTKEDQWLAMTGNAETEKDLARALLVLAKDGLAGERWYANDEEEEEEVRSWDEWVDRVEAYTI
ncbi:hypothetical protein BGZ82_008313 [Podila clonocystis]|nr:hypothetical protein BGZ82_008313 [Podila clonocystis]